MPKPRLPMRRNDRGDRKPKSKAEIEKIREERIKEQQIRELEEWKPRTNHFSKDL